MDATIRTFDDFRSLLTGELEMYRFPVADLERRFGDAYRRDTVFILQRLEEFAAGRGDSLPGVLEMYAGFSRRAAEEYRAYRRTGRYAHRSEEEIRPVLEDPQFKLDYLYVLTLSTPLNRSRYELFRHYRETVQRLVRPGSAILEIGAGNCLDALFASDYGAVHVYEINDLAAAWRDLLGLQGRIDLRLEPYRFADAGRYDFVAMIELLEHVADPAAYLAGARRVLREDGLGYFTFALRMPQVDHLSEFVTVEECKRLVYAAGFAIREEFCTVSSYLPFEEEERWRLADDPEVSAIYCCVAGPRPADAARRLADSFNDDLEAL